MKLQGKGLKNLSILKTIYFNIKCFGILSMVKLPVFVYRNCDLKSLGKIVLPKNYSTGDVKIGAPFLAMSNRKERTVWCNWGTVCFDGPCEIGAGSSIVVKSRGILHFGTRFHNSGRMDINCNESISFGSDCLVSWDTLLMDSDLHPIEGSPNALPIRVGTKVWLGCRSLVLKGAVIPDGCIAGAQCIINKEIAEPTSTIVGTNRVVNLGVKWSKDEIG